MRNFFFGAVAAIGLLALVVYIGVITGTLIHANADASPGKLERWAAKRSLNATIARQAPTTLPIIASDDATFERGIKIYADNCIVCHGAADGRPSTIGFGLYQKAPLLGHHGVEDDPEGRIYWKVRHGIRFTGMPAFGNTLNETDLWQVTLFLKNMDRLPPGPAAKWRALKNPAALVPPDRLPTQMRRVATQ